MSNIKILYASGFARKVLNGLRWKDNKTFNLKSFAVKRKVLYQ